MGSFFVNKLIELYSKLLQFGSNWLVKIAQRQATVMVLVSCDHNAHECCLDKLLSFCIEMSGLADDKETFASGHNFQHQHK